MPFFEKYFDIYESLMKVLKNYKEENLFVDITVDRLKSKLFPHTWTGCGESKSKSPCLHLNMVKIFMWFV